MPMRRELIQMKSIRKLASKFLLESIDATYQISQTIKLLAQQGRVISPTCNSAIHEIKQHTQRHEIHGSV